MRKLSQDEYDILIRIAAHAKDGAVSFDERLDLPLRKVLHGLVKKGRLSAEMFDGTTRYQMTALGWEDAA
mgnify:CR=1 FL=1